MNEISGKNNPAAVSNRPVTYPLSLSLSRERGGGVLARKSCSMSLVFISSQLQQSYIQYTICTGIYKDGIRAYNTLLGARPWTMHYPCVLCAATRKAFRTRLPCIAALKALAERICVSHYSLSRRRDTALVGHQSSFPDPQPPQADLVNFPLCVGGWGGGVGGGLCVWCM